MKHVVVPGALILVGALAGTATAADETTAASQGTATAPPAASPQPAAAADQPALAKPASAEPEKQSLLYRRVTEGKRLKLIILPVRGQGYGAMLYGYLGLADDANTVVGLSFYEHGETPGLGALIDSPEWKDQWRGKLARDPEQVLRIGVGSGPVAPDSPLAPYQVDGLTGATWTSRGVTNLLRYWLGEHGFAPYLRRLQEQQG